MNSNKTKEECVEVRGAVSLYLNRLHPKNLCELTNEKINELMNESINQTNLVGTLSKFSVVLEV